MAALIYANAMPNGFTLDDTGVIRSNDLVHSLSGVWRAFAHPYWPEASGHGQYRPLTIAAFAMEWAVGHGAAWPFHLVSLLEHVTVCLLLWRVLATMLDAEGAWAGALWFAVQPVHVEAVASAVGQSELLAATFVLAAWLSHRRGSPLAVLCFALALLSKESAVVFIGLAMGADFLFHRERRRALYLGYTAIVAAYVLVLSTVFADQPFSSTAPAWYHVTAADRWLTMLSVTPDLVHLMVAPVTLRIDYVPRVIDLQTSVTPAVMLGAGLVVAVAWLAVATRRAAPPLSYGIWWFGAAYAPVSNVVFASGIVIAERTLYLPSAGAALIVGWLASRALERWRRVAPFALAAAGVLLGVRTWTRTPDWHDDIALVKSALRDSPLAYQAHHTAGVVLAFQRRWPEAAVEYRKARELFPFDGDPYRGGAECAIAVRDYEMAAALLDSAWRIDPRQATPLIRLAQVRWMQQRWRQAGALAFAAYEMAPDSILPLDVAAGSALQRGDTSAAVAVLHRGLYDHPANAHIRREYELVIHQGVP
ncbi:MAG TPA: hypothetical protein VFA43_09475 [Gemmatimonadaceae bacterium]|nr:hypothetical protein [Gemmatimonadaceae bacterium]